MSFSTGKETAMSDHDKQVHEKFPRRPYRFASRLKEHLFKMQAEGKLKLRDMNATRMTFEQWALTKRTVAL